MNGFLLLAAAACLITFLVHILAGGYVIVRPLLASEMTRRVRFTFYFVWHMVSVLLLAMAACFVYAAYEASAVLLAVLMTILAAGFAFLNVGVIAANRLSPFMLPQWMFFAAIATLGFVGVVQSA